MNKTIKQSIRAIIFVQLLIWLALVFIFTIGFYLQRMQITESSGDLNQWWILPIFMAFLGLLVIFILILLSINIRPIMTFEKTQLIIESPNKKVLKDLKEGKIKDGDINQMVSLKKQYDDVEYHLMKNDGLIKISYKNINELVFKHNFMTKILGVGTLAIFSSRGLINIGGIRKSEIESIVKNLNIKYKVQ